MANPLLAPILGFASKLRFPTLFLVIAGLFAFDLVIPDFIPFIDEILLGLGTVLLASWKNRKPPVGSTNSNPPIEGEFKKD